MYYFICSIFVQNVDLWVSNIDKLYLDLLKLLQYRSK